MKPSFVHLRVHSEFSLIDGLVRIKPLMSTLPERGYNSVAVTDFCNLFAVVKTWKAALDSGIKPIFGADIIWYDEQKPQDEFNLLLLCENNEGYKHLTELISKAWQEGQIQGKPRIPKSWIAQYSSGLIALSGAMSGDVGKLILSSQIDEAKRRISYWQGVFNGKYFLEIQRVGRANEALHNQALIKLAADGNWALVATNAVCFLHEDDFDAHEARVSIHDGYTIADPRREKKHTKMQYLRSVDEMMGLFKDLPSALENAGRIATICTVSLSLGKNYLPDYPVPEGMSIEQYLSNLSQKGLEKRFKRLFANMSEDEIKDKTNIYQERLNVELDVINNMGFPGYFLIVADFIQWAKNNGVPVGPGRGSGAGSLVAYALEITDLDPLEYDLLFERFLNPERVSMPDFDIDFCMEGRDRVIDYVAEKYGRQSVSQIITFGTMAAKAVVRDVGRVMGHPYPFVDKLAKLIPFEIGITLSKALEQEPLLKQRYDEEDDVHDLLDLALKLEGITRNAGKHAGGVVIAPSKLTDFTAIYCEEGSSQIVSQFDKDDVEAAGLVKFDFLGLRTLTIIDWALKIINAKKEKAGEAPVLIEEIPLDDVKSFELLKACQTTAVFQLESRGMKELIGRLQPDCFEDIIALVALFRPGPLQSGMVDDFIDRKHGRAEVIYPHPDLEPILKPTYGVILYQEQVMQIAQVLANYTLGGADLLRRAMGKKKPEEMAKQGQIFTEGAVARGVDEQLAKDIFDLMEKFAGYGFNKSHSAAYALIAYQTAWLKAHYPAAFMAAVMSSDMDNTDKVVNFIDECAVMKLVVLPPCINRSFYQFTVNDKHEIIYGLGAIKGVGEAAMEGVIHERTLNGPYQSLFDFCNRNDTRKVNRRVLEALIKSGAFDVFNQERSVLFASLDVALKLAEQHQSKAHSGQLDLFSLMDDDADKEQYVTCLPWNTQEQLQGERDTLGYYLSGHPADQFRRELSSFITPLVQLNPTAQKKATVIGQISSIRKIITKRGKKLLIIGLDDGTAKQDVVVFGEIYERFDAVSLGDMILVEGEVSHDDYNGGTRLNANQLLTITEARMNYGRCLLIDIKNSDSLERLKLTLKEHPGKLPVQISYQNDIAKARFALGANWSVEPNQTLMDALIIHFGSSGVSVVY